MHAAVNESVELVRGAGLERAVSFTNAVLRRLALGLARAPRGASRGHARRGRAQALVPGLGRGDMVARLRRGAGACADAGAERASGDGGQAQRCSRRARWPESRTPELPNALRVEQVDERGAGGRADLAAEPRLAAGRALRRGAGRRAGARSLRGARRQGDPAGRAGGRGRRRREASGAGPRARGQCPAAGRRERARGERRRARAPGRPARLRPRARRRALLRPRRARLAARPALAGDAAAGAPARPAASGRRARAARRHHPLLGLHAERGGERGGRRCLGARARAAGGVADRSRIRAGRSSSSRGRIATAPRGSSSPA